MSKWGRASAKERESAPASIFCGPGRSFPVADQEDVNNAVSSLGRAGGSIAPIKACIMRRAHANNWTLPKAWTMMSKSGVPVATFGLGEADTVGDYVIRKGKLFEAGSYPDKQFEATIEDLVVASHTFIPVDNDLEHMPTILDGKLGTLMSVTLSEDNSELYGEVEIPRWLHEAIGDAPIKTSLTWDRDSMSIVGNALVIEPRVSDAAIMTAYTAFAASQPPEPVVEHPTEKTAVTILSTIRALVTGTDPKPSAVADPPQTATTPARAEEDTVTFTESDEYKAMQAKIEALEKRDTERAAREASRDAEVIRERAGVWADGEIAAFRALPAERESLVAAYVDAATDDAAVPRQVSFSQGGETKEGSRVDALKARHGARVPHTLTKEQLADSTVMMAARPQTGGEKKMDPERKKRLIEAHGFAAND
jgi:hypothetical protein